MPFKVLWLALIWVQVAAAQSSGLPPRESISYNIEWRLFSAGKARVEFTSTTQPRPESQIRLHLESTGIVSKLFRVEDDYTALLNANMCTKSTHMTAHEGSRQRETRVTYDAESRKASYLERDLAKNNAVVLSQEIEIPACVHDVVGGLMFIRSLNLEPGQSTQVPVSDGKKSVMARVEAQAREDVKTPSGTYKTIRYEIYLFNGVLYKRSAHLNVWVSDDWRRLPVQIRVRMTFTIGTINLTLEKHE